MRMIKTALVAGLISILTMFSAQAEKVKIRLSFDLAAGSLSIIDCKKSLIFLLICCG